MLYYGAYAEYYGVVKVDRSPDYSSFSDLQVAGVQGFRVQDSGVWSWGCGCGAWD